MIQDSLGREFNDPITPPSGRALVNARDVNLSRGEEMMIRVDGGKAGINRQQRPAQPI